MTNKKKRQTKPSTAPAKPARRKRRGASWWGWAAIAVPAIALTVVVVLGGIDNSGGADVGSEAPRFDLPAIDGTRQTLDAVLSDGAALLYFSMGPGCDGCFLQIPEIERALADRGITLVPVMVNPAPMVAAEAARFGITIPILIDADRTVSEAYGMIGIYGHQDRPSHSFALVDRQARITWVGHYAEMFVPADRLLADLGDRA